MPQNLASPASYAAALLPWYDTHLRALPWRLSPQQQAEGAEPNPYFIWLSEVMLQQTTVAAVKPYFAKFTARWPSLPALAAADEAEILAAWAGLGYYSRARNLKACADRLMAEHGGQFPRNMAELRRLPGLGDYTAAAIAAIAFGEPCAVVDANIERVIARLFCISEPLPKAKAAIRRACQSITPAKSSACPRINPAGDFAQAMMDLGATLCAVKKPACPLCPLRAVCRACAQNIAAELPRKAPKQAKGLRFGAVFAARSPAGKIYLRRRPPRGLLGGMTELPNHFAPRAEPALQAEDSRRAPFAANWRRQGEIRHIFTHFQLCLALYAAENVAEDSPLIGGAETGAGFWVAEEDLAEQALPSLMQKALRAAFPSGGFKTAPQSGLKAKGEEAKKRT